MKTLLFPFLLTPVVFFAQKREKIYPIPKIDTTKIQNKELSENLDLNSVIQQKDFYKMMISQPKDTLVYMALKESPKDDSKYKILNSVKPEQYSPNIKKAMPSK